MAIRPALPSESPARPTTAARPRPPRHGLARWVGQLSISRKLAAMVLANCLIVASLLVVVIVGLRTTDAVRSYVYGEGLWSKAQKSAIYHLNRYTLTADPEDFAKYEAAVGITLSIRRARLEMEKPEFDPDIAAQGLMDGGMPAADVPNMIRFFRDFRRNAYVDKAIAIWARGDEGMDELIALGRNLQLSLRAAALSPAQRQAFLVSIDEINDTLTPLEEEFSQTLSTAARWAHQSLLKLILGCAILLLGLGLWVSLRFAWQIRQGIQQLRLGAEHVARGDMAHRIPRVSDDELGDLAGSFNEMVRLRHEAELALERERHFLQATLENLAEAVIACDPKGRIWLVNRAARELHGLPAEPVVPERWADYCKLFSADGKAMLGADQMPLYRALNGQRVRDTEMVVTPLGCPSRIVLANAQALITESGQMLGAVVTLHDVTERRHAQSALAAHAQELEQANAELEQRNTQLRRLYQAEAASEAKSRFVATLSHEIRTPLHGILGLLETFESEELPGPQREKLALMHQSGRLLKHLIDDILDFAKIEAGRVELEQAPLCLQALISEVCEALQPAAARKRITLLRQVERLPADSILGDGQRLRQILLNLLSNAIKFTGEDGEVTLGLRLSTRRGQHVGLRFEVRDNGIGMDPQARDKVFESFIQGESSTTRLYGGTGLGLAICKGLIEQMGGSIGCESEPGQGSLFWFEIPAELSHRSPAGPDTSPPTLLQEDGDRTDPLRILIAEDNPINQAVIRSQLARYNCEVTMVSDGEAALAEIARQPHQLLITDLQMPRLDGIDLTRSIRQREQAAADGTPMVILGLTASAQRSTLDRCLQAGMDDCLTKPLSMAQLDLALQRWSGPAREASRAA